MPLSYRDSFTWKGKSMRVWLPSRGYLYELTPPVPIEVTSGRIRGKHKSAIDRLMLLPPELKRQFAFEP